MTYDFGTSLQLSPTGSEPPLTFIDPDGSQRLPRGIFDNAWAEIDELDSGPVSSSRPMVVVPTAEVSGVAQGWHVAIDGSEFVVHEPPHDDGTGMTTLMLSKAAP